MASTTTKESLVDPFLVEALQNPRHRLTILRMELDLQRFVCNADQQQFEFQHFPTSYLRLAAHRVAQHYGMQTMLQDNGVGNKILVRKTAVCKFPAVRLSEIAAKQSDNDKLENIKVVIRSRPNQVSANEGHGSGYNSTSMRTVEERKEEYDKARARIFSSPGSPESRYMPSQSPVDGKFVSLNGNENEVRKSPTIETERSSSFGDTVNSSRVAILRDREKDRTDPDYDRSYERYMRNLPSNQGFSLTPFNMHEGQIPVVQYDAGLPQLGHMPTLQASLSYRPPLNPVSDPFCAVSMNQMPRDATYMHWPSAAMMYADSYGQLRHSVFEAPFCQQPLSFNSSQNH